MEEVHIVELLQAALYKGWSELYLEEGELPYGRIYGSYQMEELSQYEVVRKDVLQRLIYDILTDEQIIELEEHGVLHLYYVAAKIPRFSVQLIAMNMRMEASFRVLPRR